MIVHKYVQRAATNLFRSFPGKRNYDVILVDWKGANLISTPSACSDSRLCYILSLRIDFIDKILLKYSNPYHCLTTYNCCLVCLFDIEST